MTTIPHCSSALAVLLDFLLQITAFVALIVLDFMRAEDNRIDCFPCVKISGPFMEPNEGTNSISWLNFFRCCDHTFPLVS